MVLTEAQKIVIGFLVREKLSAIFNDLQEMTTIYHLIFDEVVSDIEDTADWSNIEANAVVNSDVDIAVARVLYQKLIGNE